MSAATHEYWLRKKDALEKNVRPFIEGKYVDSYEEELTRKLSPRDGRLLMEFSIGCREDVDVAVTAARRAFGDGRWRNLPVSQRKTVLLDLAQLIERDKERLALMEALEVGKPISDAINIDLVLAKQILTFNAEAADKVFGEVPQADGRSLGFTTRMPHGVVAAVVGWNFPLPLAISKIAPALATGNSVVLKPSELSSLSALRLAELALEAGVPPGVLNVVPGLGSTVGVALGEHMGVDMLTFTGSSETGKKLMVAAGKSNMKRLLLECGGKSPNIVFADCPPMESVADAVLARMFWNQGQVCTAGTRLLLDESIKQAFLDCLVNKTLQLVPADPLDPATNFGALISQAQADKVMRYINSGVDAGANLLVGGGLVDIGLGGYYVQPTIFDGVRSSMQVAQEEIFGPVLSVFSFRDIDEALQIANDTQFGLSATVWTTNLGTAQRTINDLAVGEIDIKATRAPSPGVAFGALPLEPHKQSGMGSEGGTAGLRAYTATRAVRIFAD